MGLDGCLIRLVARHYGGTSELMDTQGCFLAYGIDDEAHEVRPSRLGGPTRSGSGDHTITPGDHTITPDHTGAQYSRWPPLQTRALGGGRRAGGAAPRSLRAGARACARAAQVPSASERGAAGGCARRGPGRPCHGGGTGVRGGPGRGGGLDGGHAQPPLRGMTQSPPLRRLPAVAAGVLGDSDGGTAVASGLRARQAVAWR